jgi:tRNA threonylcarbamoyl adenosine modification protein (Sua5/YciO/YrdC/YwlC family)
MIADGLKRGEVVIIPTDTVYAVACDLYNKKSIDRLCKVVGKKPEKANLSILCRDLSNLSEYTLPIDNSLYKLMRRLLPGPYTFILRASSKVPKIFKNNKKTIGIRVPDNLVVQSILSELDRPIVCASVHSEDDISEYITEPEEINRHFGYKVDLVVDGGIGGLEGSTVLDCSEGEIEILREGKGAEAIWG